MGAIYSYELLIWRKKYRSKKVTRNAWTGCESELRKLYDHHPEKQEDWQLAMMKAIEKRGKEKGWVYDKGWENILKSRGFSPVHLDEHIEMDEQGNPVFCYIQDERGFVSFLINPNAPKTVIHNALDSILDDLSKTKTDKRFRQEKNGALDVWGERRKRKSVNLKKLVVGRR